jgi:hypothetical protein
MKHILTVKPAIPIGVRHSIEDLLEEAGYSIAGAGQMMDKSSCDISFDSVTVEVPSEDACSMPDES